LALDIASLCQNAETLTGTWPLISMKRLGADLTAADDGARPAGAHPLVTWRVQGSLRPLRGGGDQCVIEVSADARVVLRCQRCLTPMAWPLTVERRYAFVGSEDEAAEVDPDNDDEDVLVLARRFDLRELIEDELILALPIVPRHDVCPQPLAQVVFDDEVADPPAPHPFAALAALRKRGGEGDADG